MIPVAGSAYTYAYATLGELFAWIIGWDLVLEYALGASTIAVGWAGNFVSILQDMGINFPAALTGPPGSLVALPRWQHGHWRVQRARGGRSSSSFRPFSSSAFENRPASIRRSSS